MTTYIIIALVVSAAIRMFTAQDRRPAFVRARQLPVGSGSTSEEYVLTREARRFMMF